MTKEECELALSLMCKGKKSKYIHGDGITAYGVISQLINEHFELVKENEKLKNQLVEIESSLSRDLSRDNPPLKFEELLEGMWIWDSKNKLYVQIEEDFDENGIIVLRYYEDSYNSNCERIRFEENRFYRREVKE